MKTKKILIYITLIMVVVIPSILLSSMKNSWEYNYEELMEWDVKNRKTEALATRSPYRIEKPKEFKPTAPPVVIPHSWREAME